MIRASSIFSVLLIWMVTSGRGAPAGTPTPRDMERKANEVTITFYLMSKSKWEEVKPDFQSAMVKEINDYCETNYGECGLTEWTNNYKFSNDHVEIVDVIELKYRLNVTFFVDFPSNLTNANTNGTNYVLKREAITAIMKHGRENLNEKLGYPLLAAGDDAYSPPPDDDMNLIMIPIAFAVLVVVIIVAVALHCYSLRKERRSKKAPDPTDSPSNTGKVGPAPQQVFTVENDGRRGNGTSAAQRDASGAHHGAQPGSNDLEMQKSGSLPPLEAGEDRSSRKHRHRHKKHKSKREVDESDLGGGHDNKAMNIPDVGYQSRTQESHYENVNRNTEL